MNFIRMSRATLLAQAAATAAAALTLGAGMDAADAATPKGPDRRDPAVVEAAAAAAEARRGTLSNGESPEQLRANALARCRVHQGEDRSACEALVRGEGQASGSVSGGGVLREIVIRSVGTPQDGAPVILPPAPGPTNAPSR